MRKTSFICAALAFVLTGCGSEEGETDYTSLSTGAANAVIPEPVETGQDDRGFNTVNNAVAGDAGVGERVDETTDGQVNEVTTGEPDEDAGRVELADDITPGEDVAPDTNDETLVSDDVNDESGEADTAITEEEEPDAGEESLVDSSSEGVDISALSLNGEYVPDGLPAPLFIAENHDGASRTEANLIGKPTILWFFPFAGTPG